MGESDDSFNYILDQKTMNNIRVIQRNVIYIIGIKKEIAYEKTLRSKEYFGQYGQIV